MSATGPELAALSTRLAKLEVRMQLRSIGTPSPLTGLKHIGPLVDCPAWCIIVQPLSLIYSAATCVALRACRSLQKLAYNTRDACVR